MKEPVSCTDFPVGTLIAFLIGKKLNLHFDQVKKNQKFSYTHAKGSQKYNLIFKEVVKFGDIKTLRCKVTGNHDWYKEIYLTEKDFMDNKARIK